MWIRACSSSLLALHSHWKIMQPYLYNKIRSKTYSTHECEHFELHIKCYMLHFKMSPEIVNTSVWPTVWWVMGSAAGSLRMKPSLISLISCCSALMWRVFTSEGLLRYVTWAFSFNMYSLFSAEVYTLHTIVTKQHKFRLTCTWCQCMFSRKLL